MTLTVLPEILFPQLYQKFVFIYFYFEEKQTVRWDECTERSVCDCSASFWSNLSRAIPGSFF
jgi:hypothetical protein